MGQGNSLWGVKMIDLLELKIPFDASLVDTVDERHALIGVNFEELEIPLGAKSIHFRDDGTIGTSCLYHAWESLPTSFTGMAFKVHLDGYFFPHVTIKASPAKILQGHNVFGFDDMALAVEEMLYQLGVAYPALFGMLSIQSATIVKFDITYSSRVDSPMQVRQLIDYMSRVSNGHTKPTKSKKFETTCYWGGQNSRLIRQKLYSKFEEYLAQLDDYKKLAQRGDPHARKIVAVMSDERILDIARKSVRWECTFMSRWLERNGYPLNVWEFIDFQQQNDNLYPSLWQRGFSKIHEALKGQTMKYVDDTQLLARLKSEFQTVTPKGKVSYRKALNLYGFYNQLKAFGYDEIKKQSLYGERRFNQLIADLCLCGFSKSYLQNLHVENNGTKVIPFVNFINVDFSNQNPDWYEKPISTPQKLRLSA